MKKRKKKRMTNKDKKMNTPEKKIAMNKRGQKFSIKRQKSQRH